MNLHKSILIPAFALIACVALVGCSEWTEVEAEDLLDYSYTEVAYPDSYYEALRAWKKTPHSVAFGFFSSWSEGSTSTANMLEGLPDSMDFVTIWGGWTGISEKQKADLRHVQQVKGTRVTFTVFAQSLGQGLTPVEISEQGTEAVRAFWGWDIGNPETLEPAIRKFARAYADSVYKYGYDGFEIDHEGSGDLYDNPDRLHIFLSELRKQFDERGGDKLLCVDGYVNRILPESAPLVDWFILQAYTVSSGSPSPTATGREADKDSRLNTLINAFRNTQTAEEVTNKTIIVENMESAIDGRNGGFFWRFRDNTVADKTQIPSLVGFALWQPLNGYRKGGFGGYRFDCEAANTPAYKWMRRAIQMQNPATN